MRSMRAGSAPAPFRCQIPTIPHIKVLDNVFGAHVPEHMRVPRRPYRPVQCGGSADGFRKSSQTKRHNENRGLAECGIIGACCDGRPCSVGRGELSSDSAVTPNAYGHATRSTLPRRMSWNGGRGSSSLRIACSVPVGCWTGVAAAAHAVGGGLVGLALSAIKPIPRGDYPITVFLSVNEGSWPHELS